MTHQHEITKLKGDNARLWQIVYSYHRVLTVLKMSSRLQLAEVDSLLDQTNNTIAQHFAAEVDDK